MPHVAMSPDLVEPGLDVVEQFLAQRRVVTGQLRRDLAKDGGDPRRLFLVESRSGHQEREVAQSPRVHRVVEQRRGERHEACRFVFAGDRVEHRQVEFVGLALAKRERRPQMAEQLMPLDAKLAEREEEEIVALKKDYLRWLNSH